MERKQVSHTHFPMWTWCQKDLLSVIPVIPFLILIAGFVWKTNSRAAGKIVVCRPPPQTFMIVWLTICVALAFVWWRYNRLAQCLIDKIYYSHKYFQRKVLAVNFLFIALTAMCCLWLYVYNGLRNKLVAVWVLYGILAVGLPLVPLLMDTDTICAAIFAPILAWVIFAGNIGMFEVEKR